MTSFVRPLKTDDSSEGSIHYLFDEGAAMATPGFFTFSFYIRDEITGEQTHKDAPLYIKGILEYLKLTDISPFKEWKVLIYTDQFTYDQLAKFPEFWEKKDLMFFSIVSWPKHKARNGREQVNGLVLRALRFRAPFDFPSAVHFIRDADTIFASKLEKVKTESNENAFHTFLYTWEAEFVSLIPRIQEQIPHPLIVATTRYGDEKNGVIPLYHSKNISNELLGRKTRFGVFGGFLNTIPGIPVFQDGSVWNEFIDYINERSKRGDSKTNGKGNTYYTFTNNDKGQKRTRDTQFLMFFLMRDALENLFFYNVTEGDHPTLDFEFHQKVKSVYEEMVSNHFQSSNLVYLGGKNKKRNTRHSRSKIEKRKTRKRRQPINVACNLPWS